MTRGAVGSASFSRCRKEWSDDTIQLRFGESVSGSDLAKELDNIEVIDLGVQGANSITSLTVADVLEMTDSRNTLRIDGDNADSVDLNEAIWGAGTAGADSNAGYTVYTVVTGNQAVTLEIQNGINIE